MFSVRFSFGSRLRNKENMAEGENGSAETPTALEQKIITQVEYYFGDLNLPRDRFLQDQITQDNGWVPLEKMLLFNRLKSLSEDAKVIATALKKAESGLFEVSEDESKIRRCPDKPIPENTKERRADIAARSIYAKGFPLDWSLDQLHEFFKQHGKCETIQMRRAPKVKDFKGSVFAVFSTKEEADKFVNAESVKCGETELKRFIKDDYFKMKNEEKKNLKKEGGEGEEKKETQQEKDEKLRERVKGATILFLDGVPATIPMEDLKNFFTDFGNVAWVDHDKGKTTAHVRFVEENEATEVLQKAKEAGDGKIEIHNQEVTCRVLEGEEELNHWKMIFKSMEDQRKNKQRSHNKGFNKRRNNQYKGKRRFNKDGEGGGDEPSAKVSKTETD